MKNVLILFTMLGLLAGLCASASNLQSVVNLSGYWKFNLGDDKAWAQKDFNDKDWDKVYAPGRWEDQGYVGYNGYAWYRTKITIPTTEYSDYLYLQFGKIDDVNEIYLNGVRIGQMGCFPPEYVSAYSLPLLYFVPKKLINFGGENTIAVRVYDEQGEGGIVNGQLILGYDKDIQLLNQNLAGNWKIAFKNYKGSLDVDYNDSGWDNIIVPASWESQGYNDYDGYACYRKTFEFGGQLTDEKLYLIMGKVDDKDRVYLNGKLIGETSDMYNTPLGSRNQGDWQIRRAYKIPSGLLNEKGKNVVVVLVYDREGMGGIFEGPVGIMEKEQYELYVDQYEHYNFDGRYNSLWEFLYYEVFD
jgi:hypothetical protein